MKTPKSSPALARARSELRAHAEPQRARGAMRYFKCGPGEYGEGDVFVGVSVPAIRTVARAHAGLALAELSALLGSPVHEERALALFILVAQVAKADAAGRKERFDFYLDHLRYVNNWDLVDGSAAQIVGAHVLATRDRRTLPRLARSKVLWERRVAVIATFAFLRAGETATPFAIAELVLDDPHDLMHKAVGWMLREAGKRVGEDALRGFLAAHAARMPRTALRYAVERLSPAERKRWLAVPRAVRA